MWKITETKIGMSQPQCKKHRYNSEGKWSHKINGSEDVT